LDKNVRNAILTIAKYCKEQVDCVDCEMSSGKQFCCPFYAYTPCDWAVHLPLELEDE